jgi:hypothetical protein
MSTQKAEEQTTTVEEVISAIRHLTRAERQRLLDDEELVTDLSESLKRNKATRQIAPRLLSNKLKATLATWSWSSDDRKELGLTVPVTVYVQDPVLAEAEAGLKPQEIEIDWEPGLTDGPTSARVAVVDFDGSQGQAKPAARWDPDLWAWVLPPTEGEKALPGRVPVQRDCPQFHQVNAWAIVERVLDYFEDPTALGRCIPWGFAGNRLIVVPHAGYGENAYYDRQSKSLQFYYCGPIDKRVYTCLSHDIIAHEAGHAILDGIRPYYNELCNVETSAFHEFVADLTAILVAFRNNDVRDALKAKIGGNLAKDDFLSSIGEEFARYVDNRPFIRSAKNPYKMTNITDGWNAHDRSQVMTGAMFDIMIGLAADYRERKRKKWPDSTTERYPLKTLWSTAARMSHIALQPLDFCPPVDVRFGDYAEAILAYELLIHREDPYGERKMMRKVFEKRGILSPAQQGVDAALDGPPTEESDGDGESGDDETSTGYESRPKPPSRQLNHLANVVWVTDSRASAYRFLARHRKELGIPFHRDFEVPEPYAAEKRDAAGGKLPKEFFIQYVWREEIKLPNEARFGDLRNRAAWLLCGGTLVYDENGNFLYWAFKPGTEAGTEKHRDQGWKRRMEFESEIARLVSQGQMALADDDGTILQGVGASVMARQVDGRLVLETAPRLHAGREEPLPEVPLTGSAGSEA